MELIYGYKNDDKLRGSFIELAGNTFGIDFEEWYQKGLWQNRYIPYSFVENGRIAANVSVNLLEMIIDGENKTAMQIGTVMTAEEYRNKGLSRKLMNYILKEYKDKIEIFYLFANETVIDFYPKFGFERRAQSGIKITEAIEKKPGYSIEKLNMDKTEDIEKVKRLTKQRAHFSRKFDIACVEVVYFYCLNVFRDNIYYIKGLDCIVIYTSDEGNMNIHDVISSKENSLREIIGAVMPEDITKVNVDFNIDSSGIGFEYTERDDDDDALFVLGNIDKSVKFIHPLTSRA